MTTTYHKGRLFKKPYKKVYIDGPFYPDHSLPPRERQKKLRDIAYETMCERAKLNTYEYYEYVQRDDAPEYRAKLAMEEEMKKRKKKGRRSARAAELAPENAQGGAVRRSRCGEIVAGRASCSFGGSSAERAAMRLRRRRTKIFRRRKSGANSKAAKGASAERLPLSILFAARRLLAYSFRSYFSASLSYSA